MSKLPRHIAKEIAKLAATLPNQTQGVFEKVQGKELLYDDKIPEEKKKNIVGDAWYRKFNPEGGVEVNHERRMKKAYYENGIVGYLLYFDQYVKPGQLKLDVWNIIAAQTGRELDPEFINQLNPPVVEEIKEG